MRSYHSDVEAFETWCTDRGIAPFPSDAGTVCQFLEDQGATKAPSTVRRRLYAIRKVHRLLRLPDPTHDEEITSHSGASVAERPSDRNRPRA